MRKRTIGLIGIVVLAGVYAWNHRMGEPEDFADLNDQYNYGSIGTDHPMSRAPIPYWIWRVLPELFPPSTTIKAGFGPTNQLQSYEAFGLPPADPTKNPIHPLGSGKPSEFVRPIGLSKRTVFGLDFVGVNCAFCHTSTLRTHAGAPTFETIAGGTGNTVNIEQYFLYLLAAMSNENFTAERLMPSIEKANPEMGWIESGVYRFVLIPLLRHEVGNLVEQFDFIDPNNDKRLPKFGPGRVDTWAVYKRTFVHPPQRDTIPGVSDFPAIWNQRAREHMRLHWDGNTNTLAERNIISSLALIGPRIEYMDVKRLERVTEFTMDLIPPRYDDLVPDSVEDGTAVGRNAGRLLAERGKVVFDLECADCHAPTGMRTGRVEPLAGVQTEPERIHAFTPELALALDQLGTSEWVLRGFRTQHGYANMLLDGIWLRGPYLHNGSVPTLKDLLKPPLERPKKFCRGNNVYDWENVGFQSALVEPDSASPCGEHFLYDTEHSGNGNDGHFYGTEMEEPDKLALLEFLKRM